MFRERDLANAIRSAIEASYYVCPGEPGLMTDELGAVLDALGYKPGEINDCLRGTLRSQVVGSPSGWVFSATELPISLSEHASPFDGDPRDWDAFTFVQESLQKLAREKGLAAANLSVSELYLEGARLGLDAHQLRLAVHGLPMMKLARIDAASGTISLTQQGSKWGLLNERQKDSAIDSRSGFSKILEAVQRTIEHRDPEVRWQTLRAELAAVGGLDQLTADESAVLDDVCARFAVGGDLLHPSNSGDLIALDRRSRIACA